jgi:ABC-type Fe3+-hydroxamate transport system substrate-binding protein
MKREVNLPAFPLRIISIVPSQTELLYYLGLEDNVIGITKFCIHPDQWFQSKERVGGTKSIDIEKVRALKPDLIIGNKEENKRTDIEALEDIAPVWMSDIFNMNDALNMIESIGKITNRSKKANFLAKEIRHKFKSLIPLRRDKTVLYFIWNEPMMLAGRNTFIDSMLKECGFINLAGDERYPEATGNEKPDLIFLSSEPFPFSEKHIIEFQKCYPDTKIILVDGEFFSWYGSKLIEAPEYFEKLLTQFH